MVRRQFPWVLQRCTPNPRAYVTVRLPLLLDRVRDVDYFDVSHLAPNENESNDDEWTSIKNHDTLCGHTPYHLIGDGRDLKREKI